VTTDAEKEAYLDEMRERRGYVLDYHRLLADHDFDVMRAFNELLETVYLSERRLDRKTKELIFCATLTVMRSGRAHIRSHIRAALNAGASPEEILEALEIILPEAGVVAFQEGLDAWADATQAREASER
jgi:4-carboxymuconolactone decarboxylase